MVLPGTTDWMCFLIDLTGGRKNILIEGQSDTPEEACAAVVSKLQTMTQTTEG